MKDAGVGIACVSAIVLFVGIVATSMRAARKRSEEERRRRAETIYAKYGRTELAERIVAAKVWVDQTAEQLRDSLGNPADIDEKVLKTKKKEIWKYAHQGGKRYGLRITLENDAVIGWDEKL